MKLRTWMLLTLLGLSACDDAATGGGGDEPDAASTLCPHTGMAITPEFCDGLDNDCDQRIDEDYNLEGDPLNCGSCGHVCQFGNGIATCRDGDCFFGGCPDGTFDADGDPENGCEGICQDAMTSETCDGVDNDCDGEVDEDFDLEADSENCGECGKACTFSHGQGRCESRVCIIASCEPGFGNLDGLSENGCEAECRPSSPGPELCDGEDNDCDGELDEGFDLTADGENCGECNHRCEFANAAGLCSESHCSLSRCEAGFLNADGLESNGCETRCIPTDDPFERCDEIDNDCNGTIDDGIDKLTDIENCGGCGNIDERYICRLPNANVTCEAGSCLIDVCHGGFVDVDGLPENGCETVCVPQNDGVELCNGQDDDCDGPVDEDFDLATDPANCGLCGRVCQTGNAPALCESGSCKLGPCPLGRFDIDGRIENGCEYTCTQTINPTEVCDRRDNDCNGVIDDQFDLQSSLDHCGSCNHNCAPSNAIPICTRGICEIIGCNDGYFDANGITEDGCEIECTLTADGLETCDGLDNDCDGESDEDFNLSEDSDHCGFCGNRCSSPNQYVSCQGGQCINGSCVEGWFDLNGQRQDGCEYACTPTANQAENCDGFDNDCDGIIDNGFNIETSLDHCGACNNECRLQNSRTECSGSICRVLGCVPGFVDLDRNPSNGCEAACPAPSAEVCNQADDDCDGEVDEDFELSSNISHCGACGNICAPNHGTPFCNDGRCQVLTCDAGYVDQDRNPTNGCECRVQNGGLELCNNLDDDCNGIIDDADRMVPPDTFSPCPSRGVCRGVLAACRGGAWLCPYPAAYEAQESLCDGLDNDCDGQVDEPFLAQGLGRPCAGVDANGVPGLGSCADVGTLICAGTAAIACSVTAHPERARPESCNGLDDDCDGQTDEDSDTLVTIPAGGGVAAFKMYAYEASRTDADGLEAGESFRRACSKPGALPWANVDYPTAQTACQAAGCDLCTPAQWGRACAGDANQSYPYSNDYSASTCNGMDYDTSVAAGNQDEVLPSGSLNECRRSFGQQAVYDQSGNLWEWTTGDLSLAQDGSARALRGGSYGNIAGGLTCGYVLAAPPSGARENIGFRCCCPR